MKPVALAAMAAFIIPIAGVPAQAQTYPWCAYYSGGDMGGATNCGFSTFAQCMATISGIGGMCQVNTQYIPPAGPHAPARDMVHRPS